jgi:hypothetical protein
MRANVVWHGTQEEALALIVAMTNHCQCEAGPDGARRLMCSPHRMFMEDQRAMDGLLFVRRQLERWRDEERARGSREVWAITSRGAIGSGLVWHGTDQEIAVLDKVAFHNCACEWDAAWTYKSPCAVHRMLDYDQRALDGLVFARRMADRLRQEEFARSSARTKAGGRRTLRVLRSLS